MRSQHRRCAMSPRQIMRTSKSIWEVDHSPLMASVWSLSSTLRIYRRTVSRWRRVYVLGCLPRRMLETSSFREETMDPRNAEQFDWRCEHLLIPLPLLDFAASFSIQPVHLHAREIRAASADPAAHLSLARGWKFVGSHDWQGSPRRFSLYLGSGGA